MYIRPLFSSLTKPHHTHKQYLILFWSGNLYWVSSNENPESSIKNRKLRIKDRGLCINSILDTQCLWVWSIECQLNLLLVRTVKVFAWYVFNFTRSINEYQQIVKETSQKMLGEGGIGGGRACNWLAYYASRVRQTPESLHPKVTKINSPSWHS